MAATSLFQSPEDYLLEMISRVQARGSRITDFVEGSTARSLYEGFAAALSHQSGVVEQLRLDSYLATATGDALDALAANDQVTRKPAIAATGSIKITRAAAGAAVSIPAGWGQLVTPAAPGKPPVAYVTTADAVFAAADTAKTVPGVAVVAGASGNVSRGALATTALLAQNPVDGFQSDGDFMLLGPWTNGVDAEDDDALRVRIPLEIQGRVRGRWASFMAGALGVPGVTGAQVLQGGDARLAGTVAAGSVEVYYKGDASLLAAVTNACEQRTVLDQNLVVTQATSLQVIADLQVFVLAGVDTAAVSTAVENALIAVVDACQIGTDLPFSNVVQAVHAIGDVQSVNVPFNQWRLSSEAAGTSHTLPIPATKYPTLAAADISVTVTEL